MNCDACGQAIKEGELYHALVWTLESEDSRVVTVHEGELVKALCLWCGDTALHAVRNVQVPSDDSPSLGGSFPAMRGQDAALSQHDNHEQGGQPCR